MRGSIVRGKHRTRRRSSRPRRSSRRHGPIGPAAIVSLSVAAAVAIPIASQALYPSVESAWANTELMVDLIAIEATVDSTDDSNEIRGVIMANADSIAAGDTSGIPEDIKQQIRDQLSPGEIDLIRSWFSAEQPSGDEIRRVAREL